MSDDNILGQLRLRRTQLTRGRTQVFSIPGYEGTLAVVCRVLDFDELKKVGEQVMASTHPQKELIAGTQQLIDCTVKFQAIHNGEDELRDLTDEEGNLIENWQVLGDKLGAETTNVREAVWMLFNNDPALLAFVDRIGEWMKGNQATVNRELVGESNGTVR